MLASEQVHDRQVAKPHGRDRQDERRVEGGAKPCGDVAKRRSIALDGEEKREPSARLGMIIASPPGLAKARNLLKRRINTEGPGYEAQSLRVSNSWIAISCRVRTNRSHRFGWSPHTATNWPLP